MVHLTWRFVCYKRQVKYTMRNLIVMSVAAVCFLFLFEIEMAEKQEFVWG